MSLCRVLAPTDKGETITIDTVFYRGEYWLVTAWLDYHEEKAAKPARMLRVEKAELSRLPPNAPADFRLTRPIPTAVLENKSDGEFDCLRGDQIPFGIPFSAWRDDQGRPLQ